MQKGQPFVWLLVCLAAGSAFAEGEKNFPIAGTASDGAIHLVSRTEALSTTLVISAGTASTAGKVKVRVLPLLNAGTHESVAIDPDSLELEVSAGAPARFPLAATLRDEGEWRAEIHVTQGTQTEKTELVVRRGSAQSSLVIGPIDTAAGDSWSPFDVRYAIREGIGASVEVKSVTATLSRKTADGQLIQLPVAVPLDAGTPATTIAPGGVFEGALRVPAGAPAGQYQGTLSVTTGDGRLSEQTFTVLVRTPWWQGLLLISLGVAVSAALRWWYRRKRPALVIGKELLALRTRVATAVSTQADALEAETARVVTAAIAALEAASADAGAVEAMGRRIELFEAWVQTHRLVSGVKPASVVETIALAVEAVRSVVVRASPDAATLAEQLATLAAVPGQVAEAVLGEVRRQVDALRSSADAAGVGPQIAAPLAAAEAALTRSDLDGARAGLDQARRAWVEPGIAALRAALTKPPPPAVSPAQWQSLSTDLDAARVASPDEALERYRAVEGRYLRAVIGALHDEVKKQGSPPSLVATLADASKALAAGQHGVAARRYDEACVQYAQLPAANGGQLMGPNAPAPVAPAVGIGALDELPSAPVALPFFKLSPAVSLRFGDAVASVVVALIAVLSGFFVLDIDSETWGGLRACMLAFTWGLGLNQAGGQAVDSILNHWSQKD